MNYSLTLFLNLVFRSAISILVWTLLIRPESIPQVPQPKVYPRYPQGINVSFDPTLASELQFTIDSLRTLRGFKGISVGVTLPNQGTWFGVSGISHAGVNITPGMKFGIASQTKTFMAVLILKLAEMNVLNLDDSLDKWIPSFPNVDSTITIRQLLNHTSGVYNFTEKPGFLDSINVNYGRYWSPEEILSTFLASPYCIPGACWHYSNTNYVLAGMVVKAATGSSVSSKLRELILDPLGLDDTYFDGEETVGDTIAHAWLNSIDISGRSRTATSSSGWTSAAMYSTTENMDKFYAGLFAGQIIDEASLDEMLTFIPTGSFPPSYGLGIGRAVLGGGTEFGHDGNWFGYRSATSYDSVSGYRISVLINTLPGDPLEVLAALLTVINNYHEVSVSLPIVDGWNLLSVPVNHADMSKTNLYPTAASPAFAYQGTYLPQDTLVSGSGFWLKYSGAETLRFAGSERFSDTIDVVKGWNMIGSLSEAIAVNDIESIPGGIGTTQFFGYNGSYVPTDSLYPGWGYWVRVDTSGKLVIASPQAVPIAGHIRIVPTNDIPPASPSGDESLERRARNIPTRFALEQNYPNPFNPVTQIAFSIPTESFVSLTIHDMLGRDVVVLVKETKLPGNYSVTWIADDQPSGVYFCRLNSGVLSETRKLILQK